MHVMEITSLNFYSRLATWKEVLLGGNQTHDGLDDCRDLRDIVAKLTEAELALMTELFIQVRMRNVFTLFNFITHSQKCFFQERQENWTPSCRNLMSEKYYQTKVCSILAIFIYQYTLYFSNVAQATSRLCFH